MSDISRINKIRLSIYQNIQDKKLQNYVIIAFDVLLSMELFDFFDMYNPPKETGYTCDPNKTIEQLLNKINVESGNDHTGFTMGMTIRNLKAVIEESK
jgi:hypothetical protein